MITQAESGMKSRAELPEFAVEAEGLWCAHAARFVLRDVSFRVRPGEIAVIVGVNGVGKSTLLSTLAGATTAARGEARVHGHPRRKTVESEKAARQVAAYLPDDPWLPGSTQLREYLGAAAGLFGVPLAQAIDRIDALLVLFALTTCESQSLGSLSTGQRKKAGLCAALISDRPVLLLDEPFSGGLDPAGIAALRRVLRHRANQLGQTIVLTTPVAEVVAELADRLLILCDGQLGQDIDRVTLQQTLSQAESAADALNSLIFPDADARIRQYFDRTTSGSDVGGQS